MNKTIENIKREEIRKQESIERIKELFDQERLTKTFNRSIKEYERKHWNKLQFYFNI